MTTDAPPPAAEHRCPWRDVAERLANAPALQEQSSTATLIEMRARGAVADERARCVRVALAHATLVGHATWAGAAAAIAREIRGDAGDASMRTAESASRCTGRLAQGEFTVCPVHGVASTPLHRDSAPIHNSSAPSFAQQLAEHRKLLANLERRLEREGFRDAAKDVYGARLRMSEALRSVESIERVGHRPEEARSAVDSSSRERSTGVDQAAVIAAGRTGDADASASVLCSRAEHGACAACTTDSFSGKRYTCPEHTPAAQAEGVAIPRVEAFRDAASIVRDWEKIADPKIAEAAGNIAAQLEWAAGEALRAHLLKRPEAAATPGADLGAAQAEASKQAALDVALAGIVWLEAREAARKRNCKTRVWQAHRDAEAALIRALRAMPGGAISPKVQGPGSDSSRAEGAK